MKHCTGIAEVMGSNPVSGADPRFDDGGSDKRGPGAWSPGEFLILGPLKCDFQRFQGQFEVV